MTGLSGVPSISMGVSNSDNPRGATTEAQPAQEALAGHPKYRWRKNLGQGTFGLVQLCEVISSPLDKVAVKLLPRRKLEYKYVKAEILNHRKLRHGNVIKFHEVFLTPDYICIVMEFAEGFESYSVSTKVFERCTDLFTYVNSKGRLTEVEARGIFRQLISGLDYCHQRGVVNRDVKLDNTLLHTVPSEPLPVIKICDFGYSKSTFCDSAPKSMVGTQQYMAPEVIFSTVEYDGALADVWSCGVMLFTMLVGRYLLEGNPPAPAKRVDIAVSGLQQLQENVDNALDTHLPPLRVSDECRRLLFRLLEVHPGQRITMAEIFVNPWFAAGPPGAAPQRDAAVLDPSADYNGVQTVEDIEARLEEARGHNPMTEAALIDGVIQFDQDEHPSSYAMGGAAPVEQRADPSGTHDITAHAAAATLPNGMADQPQAHPHGMNFLTSSMDEDD